MERKSTFTKAEIEQIEGLIEQKIQTVSSLTQKSIRNRIREIGFHWEDFHPKNESPKVKFDIINFRNLIAEGRIRVIDVPNNELQCQPMNKSKKRETYLCRMLDFFSSHNKKNVKEGLGPWVGKVPRVLILGSMPGDESIKQQTYYANTSHNSFWKIMYAIFPKVEDQSNKEYITSLGIALWDCVHSAVREKSTDDGFDNNTVVPNDMHSFMAEHPSITAVIINGKGKPAKFYKKYFSDIKADQIFILNSTSNACAITFDEKLKEWSILKKIVK